MSRYVLAPEVRHDLREIYEYIRRDNPRAAGRLRELFFKAFESLANHPLIGQARPDLAENVRIFPVHRSYVVLYQPTSDGIEVLQVAHGARDLSRIFRRPPES